jgi:hypothetical protein
MTPQEAKELLAKSTVAPDDLEINRKRWKLEGTYLTKKEALGSAEFFESYRLFKYQAGYALYERSFSNEEEL